jgi:hypothetical protein
MRRWIAIITLSIVTLAAGGSAAAQQDAVSAQITSPKAGEPLFGPVSITGTASHPNMQRYTLEWDSQDTETDRWFPIAGPIAQQVRDGVLGQWNTTTVPDGRYQIRLRVVLRDGTVLSDVVQNLRVQNQQPSPLPTVLPSATPVPPTLPPTVGPSPTPIIEQPPTSSPRPAALAAPPTVEPAGPVDDPQLVVAVESLRSAFCSGIYLALVAFAIVIVYSVIHARVRPALRRRMNRGSYRD